MNERDRSLLEDMRTNAGHAIDLSAGLNAAELRASIPALYSTLYAIQIVGEAAARVSEDTRSRLVAIPWAEIVATRHIIVHGYHAVDPQIVVAIVEDHLPALIAELNRLLGGENP